MINVSILQKVNIMKKTITKIAVLITISFSLSSSWLNLNVSYANDVKDAMIIVKKSDDLLRGETCQGLYRMTVKTDRWERQLDLNVFTKGRDKIFIRILSPAKESGIGTLRIENEMWNYLPKIERIIKIPPSMMLQSWMGSDFANDDLVKESSVVNDYTHKIVEEMVVDGKPVYKIEFIPKPDAAVIWGKLFMWIRKDDFVPIKEEFYNEKGKLIKVLEYSNIAQVSDRVIPKTWKMRSIIKEDQETTIELIDVKYNEPVDDNIFSLVNLKKNL